MYLLVHKETERIIKKKKEHLVIEFFRRHRRDEYDIYELKKDFIDTNWVFDHLFYLETERNKITKRLSYESFVVDPKDLPYHKRLLRYRYDAILKRIQEHKLKYGLEK